MKLKSILICAIAFVFSALPAFPQAWSTFLDTSRATDWSSAGFTIPNYTVPCSTQPTLLAGGANAAANKTAIQNALASCDATHNVVNLPAGTYSVAGITYPTQGKQVLRGAGANSTKLILTATVGCTGVAAGICMNGATYYAGSSPVLPPSGVNQCSWTAGYAKGSASITLNSCGSSNPASTGLTVGALLILDQSNDLTDNGGIFLCDSATSSQAGGAPACTLNDGFPSNFDGRRIGGFTYSQKQVVKITSISGSGTGPYTVGLSAPVYFNNISSGKTPGAWWAGNTLNEGLENVFIDGTAVSPFNVEIAGCNDCWVKGVSSFNADRAHVQTNLSYGTVIRDSYFFQSQSHSSQSYGYEPEQTSAELVENNIFQQVTSPLITGNTSGSVVDYNLMTGSVYVNSNYLQSSYASHNAGNDMDLYEGNNILNVATDDTWGSSNTETFFRNFNTGWQHQASGPLWNTSPFIDRSFSRAHNLVGNVLGQPGFHTNYESYATSTSSGVNGSLLSVSIYSLGWSGSAETSAGTCNTPGCDAVVRPTLMRWGNYDTVNAATQWNSTEAAPAAVTGVNANFTTSYFNTLAHTLPPSLYYSSTPSWWPSGKVWPPIGPDVSSGNVGTCSGTYSGAQATSSSQCTGGTKTTAWASHVVSIPAQDCYLTTLNGPPDGTGSVLPFDASTCYAAGPTPPRTLTKITILPPTTGFFISSPTNTGTAQLSTLCTYSDSSTDDCTAAGGVTWFSDNTGIATINSTGLVSGTGSPVPSPSSPLYVNIIAYNGNIFGRTQVQINSYIVNCLVTRPESPDSTVVLGSTILISAVDCSPDSGASSPTINGPGVGDFVAYTTSDATKAVVNPQGEVTAVGAGTATITLHLPGIVATRNLTITNPTVTNTTYYVREDGGTIKDANVPGGQCDGTLNVPLAGSSGGHCAVNNPMYCFTDETSSSVYTGLVHAGDTCLVTPRANGAQYPIVQKSAGVPWIGPNGTTMAIPSGTPSNPTKLLGSNYASCSNDPHHLGNRAAMNSLGQQFIEGYNYSTQNIDVECIDFDSGVDCNSGLHTNSLTFDCPSGAQQEPAIIVDQFTSNFQMKNVRIHGYYTSMDGTPGPGTKWINVTSEFNTLDGTNFDNPYGFTGNRGDGFYADGAQFNFNGFSEERVKPLSGGSVSRDGSGNLNVTFPSGSIVNYVPGTNLVLAGMTPSDLNGTFPVSSITFNQNTANITGGTLVSYNDGYGTVWGAQFTTSSAPTFGLGAFVNITGASPSFLNGTYEVFSVSSTGFVVAASQYTHPGWTSGTISSGGTASTAISLVATAPGSSETASVLGTASHVTPAHRGMDQQDTGFANGDGWGSGNAAMNDYFFTNCQFHRNTQDGLDGLHSNIHTSTFTFCISEGNEGAPVKAGNADFVFHNDSFMDSNAGANMAFDPNLPPEYNQYLSTFFRANDGYGINNGAWSTFIATNNTFEVGQNVFIDDRCNSPSGCTILPFAKFYFQNNVVLGYNDLNNPTYDGSPPALYFPEAAGVPNWQWFNNISINTRNAPSGGSGNLWSTDPQVVLRIPDIANLSQEVNALYGNYNVNITNTSPAIQGGVANIYVPTVDFNHTATTSPNPVVGALNFVGSTPTLVSITVAPNPGSVNVAATLPMSCTAHFSDSSQSSCSSPVWTDTAAHSSVNSTTGVVTGVSSGSDTVTATIGTIHGSATVNVIAPSTYRSHSLGTTKSLGIGITH